jgi:hypothetical protein
MPGQGEDHSSCVRLRSTAREMGEGLPGIKPQLFEKRIEDKRLDLTGGGGVPPGAQLWVQQGSKRVGDHTRRLYPRDEQTEMASMIGMDNTAIKHVKDAAGERSDGMYMLKIIVVPQGVERNFRAGLGSTLDRCRADPRFVRAMQPDAQPAPLYQRGGRGHEHH